jgi:hypothetical protein
MPFHSKISGSWQKVSLPMTRVSGTWKPAKQVWTKVNGEWKKIFDLETEDPFDGSGNLDGQDTPGYAPWKTYKGSWSKSGGSVTAGSLDSVAGIETGVSDNLEIEIDINASQSGAGTAFWIQDQNNWWGAQTFYQQYSFTNAPTTTFYNYSCNATYYNVTTNFNTPTPGNAASYFMNVSESVNYSAVGQNFSYGYRECRDNGTVSGYTAISTGCTGSCSTLSGPSQGSACGPPGGLFYIRNCGSTCANCTVPTPFSTSFSLTGSNCISGTTNSGSLCSGTVSSSYSSSYSCTFNPGSPETPGTPLGCTHTVSSNAGPFLSNSTGQDFRSFTPPCAGSTVFSCTPSPSSITTPGNTVTSTFKQTRLIRSVGGTVSAVSGTVNNIGDGNNIGGLVTRITPTQVRTTAYSSAARTGTAFPSQTYTIPSGISKGTKHGIMVSGVPNNQTYSISRFKATMI